MTPLPNILNLPVLNVLQVREDEHDYHVDAEVASAVKACASCQSTDVVGWGAQEILVRDLPMHGKRVGIYLRARRFRCNRCEKTSFERIPAVSEKRNMTERLVKWIGQQSLKRVFTSIADEAGVDEKTVRNIFRDYVTDLERDVRVQIPRWLGIDEIHIIKKPRCVIANIEANAIVDILPDRNKKTVAAYLQSIRPRARVKFVAMDMWAPSRDAVATVFPDATIVIDKFHVVRMANVAMEQVRKALRAELAPKERRSLMHDRFILLKRERDLTAQERFLLDSWTSRHVELGEAYRLKERFFALYDAKDRHDAADAYGKWATSIPPSLASAFSPITTAWRSWHDLILNYFEHPVTNAYTESLNNLIRVMNRLGRGYSFEALRAKLLFTEGLNKSARPRFERKSKSQVLPYVTYAPGRGRMRVPTFADPDDVNLGVYIPTLTQWLEEGRL